MRVSFKNLSIRVRLLGSVTAHGNNLVKVPMK